MYDPAAPVALFVSPHLDDVAFSCSGLLARLGGLGWRVAVATVFTRSVPDPAGFALACQLDKGLAPGVDYMALRRAEDAEFGRALGVVPLEWLDLPEAPHRGYGSPPELFAGVRPDDAIAAEVGRRLGALLARLRPDWVFAPQGIGNHADHLQVIRAIAALPDGGARVAWYRDLPYAAKFPAASAAPDLPGDMVEVAIPLGPDDLAAKVAASACYATQAPFQFGPGGPAAIARLLGDFAYAEGERLGHPGPVEAFRIAPSGLPDWEAGVCSPLGAPRRPDRG